MTSDLEKSFKSKLRTIAKETNRDPSDLWQALALERFLVRLAKSKYREHFILKGGVLLSKYLEIGRETTDLDFLARKITNTVIEMQTIFGELASIDLPDGFQFKEIKVNELAHPHMGYPGICVEMTANFGKTRNKVSIDIGFGDIVDPIEYSIPLTTSSKGALFEDEITLICYPKEFIFAEKLETVIHLGSFNSRMKDFHDLYSMITSIEEPLPSHTEETIRKVFENRKTKPTFPIEYAENEMIQMQKYWYDYNRSLSERNVESLPKNFADVISKINEWIQLNTSFLDQ
jgi:predicted nucleotidyltransferase component of viral defense system